MSQRPGTQRPGGGSVAQNRPGSAYNRSSPGQLNDFLGLPSGSGIGAGAAAGAMGGAAAAGLAGRDGGGAGNRGAAAGAQRAFRNFPAMADHEPLPRRAARRLPLVAGVEAHRSVAEPSAEPLAESKWKDPAVIPLVESVAPLESAAKAGRPSAAVAFPAYQGSAGSIANVSRGYADTAGNRAGGSLTAAQNRVGILRLTSEAASPQAGSRSSGFCRCSPWAWRECDCRRLRGAVFQNGQFVGGRSGAAVNGNFTRWNTFNGAWVGRYPGCWWPGKWAIAGSAWAWATWPYASSYSGCTGEPVYYDYGENVAYDDGTVYAEDQPIATEEEYYAQAEQIASSPPETTNEEWMPLGVFAVISDEEQTNTDKVLQLAINRDAVIRGNLHDVTLDKVTPVIGAVDKSTQRVSLKLEGNDSLVLDTSLYNLTNDEVPVLVHFAPDRREGRVLIRLKNPELENQQTTETK